MSLDKLPTKAVIHPLVLLSVVDHYNRVAQGTKNRVAGVLLGSVHKGVVDITNSFAVPFEEDLQDPSIWFLDHNFVETMFGMFRRVAAREVVVGWYSTGPKIKKSDIDINEIFRKYVTHPVYVIVDVKPKEVGIPTDAYVAVEEIQDERSQPKMTFKHLPSEIGALEAEEIGVEHLLRDVKDTTISDLHGSVSARLASLKALQSRLSEVHKYLSDVSEGKLPVNHQIMYNLQDVFNLLPGLQNVTNQNAFTAQTNDNMLNMYTASIIRSVVALHNLINNKIDLRAEETKEADKVKADKAKAKEKENAKDKDKDSKDSAKKSDKKQQETKN